MAVYTTIDAAELHGFLRAYAIGEPVSCEGIAEGVENSNFLLTTSQGRFILTLFEKRVKAEDLPFFMALKEHLAKKGIDCPAPVRRRDGDILGTLADRPAAIVSFLQGAWPREPQAHHCAAVGAEMARMHHAVGDFPGRRANALSVSAWRSLFEQVGGDAERLESGLAAMIRASLDDLERNWPKDLPTGVIHADAFPDNVFFKDGALSGVIDFYFACSDFFAYDLAIMLNAWCFDAHHRFDRQKGAAMLNAYQATRPLSESEKRALPLLCAGAAMRFFVTRLYDDFNRSADAVVTVKDPRQPLAWLRFHQAAADLSAYGLETERA